MTISKEDFKNYNISQIMASESGKSKAKRIIVCIDNIEKTRPDVYFEIFYNNNSEYKTYSLDEAISYYNKLWQMNGYVTNW